MPVEVDGVEKNVYRPILYKEIIAIVNDLFKKKVKK